MSAQITLFDNTTYEVTDHQARQITDAMAAGDQFIKVNGSVIAVSAIKRFDNVNYTPERVQPPHMISAPRQVTPWKVEQFQELKQRHAEHMAKPVGKRGRWLAWIETEAEFREVMAGKKDWPRYTGRKTPRHDTVVVDENNKMVSSYASTGYYGETETAARREANKLTYMPQWKREQLEREQAAKEKQLDAVFDE